MTPLTVISSSTSPTKPWRLTFWTRHDTLGWVTEQPRVPGPLSHCCPFVVFCRNPTFRILTTFIQLLSPRAMAAGSQFINDRGSWELWEAVAVEEVVSVSSPSPGAGTVLPAMRSSLRPTRNHESLQQGSGKCKPLADYCSFGGSWFPFGYCRLLCHFPCFWHPRDML